MTTASRLVALAGCALVGWPVMAQPVVSPPGMSPGRTTIGRSTHGQAIEVWTLGAPGADAHGRGVDERPALLIVAGVQGHHTVGVETARAVAAALARDHAALVETRTVYVIPLASPDGTGWVGGERGARIESGRIPGSGDADRDGRTDEDGAEDLNGDGMITQMRVRQPDARWGLRANLIPDPDNPRLMREAKPDKGEVGQWAVMQEGTDNDGDGRFNEDGGGGSSGGVDLNMNFATHYPEHEDGAGAYSMSSPEAVAIARWVQSRPNIVAAVVYDTHDSIVNVPAAGQYGPEGSVPRGIEEGDKAYYQHVSEAFKEVTGMTGAPTGRTAGTLASWLYGDAGVWTFSTPVWVRPDLVKAEGEGGGEGGEGGGGGGDGGEAADPKAAERAALIAEGFPARVADFLVASPSERAAIMAQVESMTEAERTAMMAEVMALTPAQQQRVMEAVRGGRGGGPPPGGPAPGGPPVNHHHHEEEEEGAPSFEAFVLQTIAQPAGGFGGGGGQPGGPGRRGGGAGGPGAGAAGGGGGGGGGARAGGGGSSTEDGKWLSYFDGLEGGGGSGFVEWAPFEHPQLGAVEIGGFVPGARVNPPGAELERLAAEQTAFVARLLPMLPDVVIESVEAERVAGDLWRVRARVSNPGFLPTASAIGAKARRLSPIVVQVSVEPTRVLSGQRVRRFDTIEGSGSVREAEWLVQASAGEEITVEVRSDVFGTSSRAVRLGQGGGR